MADRAAHRGGGGVLAFARALILLGAMVIGAPSALIVGARERFDGASPLHGVPSPTEWSAGRVRSALSDQLTDDTIADIVIRVALLVAWVAVVVFVLTVVFETIHMVRHDGLSMPDVRGLGMSQRAARVVASGLLTLSPLLTSGTAVARAGSPLLVDRVAVGQVDPTPAAASPRPESPRWVADANHADSNHADSSHADSNYVVQPGDSIFGIAERIAGSDTANVAAYAERLVDLNVGREMVDGRRFTNAAFIDVGWVLALPERSTEPSVQPASVDETGAHVVENGAEHGVENGAENLVEHIVVRGESLWSIAESELGDPMRWRDVFALNEGRTFADGSTLTNPDLIRPGWNLDIPLTGEAARSPRSEPEEQPVDQTADQTADQTVSAEQAPAVTIDVPARTVPEPESHPSDGDTAVPAAVPAAVPVAGAPETPTLPSARGGNVWDKRTVDANPAEAPTSDQPDAAGEPAAAAPAPSILMLGSAAMISSGALTLLAVRRRGQLRRARSRTRLTEPTSRRAATERALRAIDTGERFDRVELAIRAAARPLVASGGRVLAVLADPDGALELRASVVVELGPPWMGSGATWRLAASTPLELLVEAAEGVCSPCPTLVQLGTDDGGRDLYVDLETIEGIEIGGRAGDADAIVAGVAATLAGSPLAGVTTLIGVGVPDDAFLGHRRYVRVGDARRAFEAAADAIGSTGSMATSTFALRTHGTADETWEPAVVLVGAAAGDIELPGRRTGLAVVSASPVHGPSSRLEPDGDAWILRPAGIRLTPIGLTPGDIRALAELVTVVDTVGDPDPDPGADPDPAAQLDRGGFDADDTIVPTDLDDRRVPVVAAAGDVLVVEDEEQSADPSSSHPLVVRLLGQVAVVDGEGRPAAFERSKSRELIAWLATHRERATRSAARTALWELDVRDATFANVVSEARRSLARLVEPPDGEEWVGRTMTDALPLHAMVATDADLIRTALDRARVQPPAQAIATLTPAVELIAGVPFEGTSYLWPDSEGITSSLVLLAMTASTELAAHCLSIGDIEGVFEATGRGLQVLPGHEELIGLRMEAHARAGDNAGVRLEWESYERVINDDPWSDGEPAPKLVELRQRLLNPSR